MTSYMWILLLASFVSTRAQDFNLADAFDDDPPPTKRPVAPAPPKNPNPGGFDLSDAFDLDDSKKPAVNPPKSEDPKKPTGGDGFDLSDALGPDTEPKKPVVKPPKGGGTATGGGNIEDSDLFDLSNDESGYKPDGGKSGGRGADPGHEDGASEQPQGTMAAIISSVGVALIGAASGYIAYQKKKLCFKIQGGQDPESGKVEPGGTSDNQVFSNLLRSS